MSDNPLKQYFRRPGVYIKLPSGGVSYSPNDVEMPENGEFPIYPMTAIDEITSRTPDALFNGSAVVDIIKSCVPNIKNPWVINNVDLDPILVAIRTATHGSTMEIETECPSCTETSKFDVNLPAILAGFKPGDYQTPLQVTNDVIIKFRPLMYKETNEANMGQFQIQKSLQNVLAMEEGDVKSAKVQDVMASINTLATQLIAASIEYVKVPTATVMEREFILEFLKNVGKQEYDKIRDHSVALRESTMNKPLDITCPHCTHEFSQGFSINASDFFD